MTAAQKHPPKAETYSTALISLHWFMALLIAAVFAAIELREYFPKGSDPREQLKALHFMLGLSVLVLVLVRVALRLREKEPPIVPPLSALQAAAAGVMHATLYAAMIIMPVLGWLTLSAAGKPIPFFGLNVPALIGGDKTLAESLESAHALIGNVLYYVIGLHVLAALVHHYGTKDNTLKRMLPRSR